MRPVNLLPERFRPLRGTGARSGIAYAAIGTLAVLLVMVVLYVVTSNGINDAEEKTAQAQAEEAEAQARIGALRPYGDFATLRRTREAAVRGVALGRFDYERLLREIALVMPKDTYLTTLSATGSGTAEASAGAAPTTATTATATGPSVAVAGCAPDHPGVATAIVRLRNLHNVVDVNLGASTKGAGATEGAVCRVSWTATLTFEGETATATERSVPARLGGGR